MPNNNGSGISNTNNNKYSKPRTENVDPSCVVITYSSSPTIEATLAALHKREASVHYTIEETGRQDQYANDLSDQTFYAGASSWRGMQSVNNFGIGMMLIHYIDAKGEIPESKFPELQIEKLIAFLQDLQVRYPKLDLKNNLVGLGEVAARHVAPGKLFPWQTLAIHGFGQYIATTPEQQEKQLVTPDSTQEEISDLQTRLRDYGYAIKVDGRYDDKTDNATARWIIKFNNRYVPDQTLSAIWTEASEQSLQTLLANRPLKEKAPISESTLFSSTAASEPTVTPTAPTVNLSL